MTAPSAAAAVLKVRGLKKYFPLQRGVFKRTVGWIPAVDDVSFTVHEGETLGVVGESGCGKTTMIREHHPRHRPDLRQRTVQARLMASSTWRGCRVRS